ncbi:MAG TPA: hypothetical protein VNX15_06295, partial [Gemmatimonadales bacterium]|nr:hypothetical protein [Gemmatimonadales bacterium]
MRRLPRLLVVALVVIAACILPDDPAHLGGYPFTDISGNIFHWPGDRLPVRFWVDPHGNMNALVQNAIDV